ncbi:MAG TPA: hypothetical protein VIA62_10035 [Thermoanaerobaculia bacterium]|jgi:hypothetical protein|nr:hypothetical protein [Thermoanaerobaculia bacterium]
MRSRIASLLPPLLLAQACASGGPPLPTTSLDAAPLAAVNRAIEDQPVKIRLASGEVVEEAEGVVMTPESTSWLVNHGRVRTVPTAEVCQVIRQVRFRAGKGYAWGLLACAPLAYGVGNANNKDLFGGFASLLLTEMVCPLAGLLITAGFKQPPDRVVYSAPGSCGLIR